MAAPQSHSPEPPAERKVPIKALIMTLVLAQPVIVAASLYYTEVLNKKEPVRCDPALIAALEAPPPVPDSSFYNSNPPAKKAYEDAFVGTYQETIRKILEAGCNAPELKMVQEAALPVAETENARRNGVNDGFLAAKQLPRECLNHCWQRVARGGGARRAASQIGN